MITVENSSKKPKIRFKGFNDDWEQRKFENIFNYERPDKYIVNSTEYLEFGPTPVLTANKAFILGYTTEKNKYVNSHESIIFDDFTLDTKFVDFPYMVKSSAIKILTLKDEKKDNIRFNFELLSNHRFNMLGHARHYISVVQPEEVFTTNKQEQNKIGDLFTNIDNLITLHQRKYDKLVEVKKFLLEKMFPEKNSKMPQIRFKGFTNDWEQRKFENIFNYERPDKYIVNSTEYLEFGPTPVLTANKAFILGYTTEKNKYVNSHESIIFDDFTLDTKFVDFPYMVKSSAIKILTLKDEKKDNIRFNFELLSNHRFNMLGHARHYISVVQPEEVFTTNKQEQNKIGDLFTNIDNLITLHQRKLDKLKNLKNSLLENMFV